MDRTKAELVQSIIRKALRDAGHDVRLELEPDVMRADWDGCWMVQCAWSPEMREC